MAKHFVKRRHDFSLLRSVLTPIFTFVIVITLFHFGLQNLSETTAREQLESTRRAVLNATVQCYALEGQFPTSVQYLKDHYGLQVDTDKYIVDYGFLAGNMMPDITVMPRFFSVEADPLPDGLEVLP